MKKRRFCFYRDSTYIIFMGKSVTKGKKLRKESGFPFWITKVFLEGDFFIVFVERHKKEKRRGFSSNIFGGVLWEG